MVMSLDGLRAWIGLVERKLTMRTRVFLVLVAIAIGGAATGIVLAVDARNNSISKDELQAVRDERAGGVTPAEASDTAALKAEIETLRDEVTALRGEGEAGGEEASVGTEGSSGKENGTATTPQNRRQLKEAGEEAIEESKEKGSK